MGGGSVDAKRHDPRVVRCDLESCLFAISSGIEDCFRSSLAQSREGRYPQPAADGTGWRWQASCRDGTRAGAELPKPGSTVAGGRNGWLVFAATVLVYASTAGGSLTTTDAVVTYQVTQRLVEERTFALPEGSVSVVRRGIEGRNYAPFGIAQSIYNILFFLVGRIAQSVTGLQVGGQDTLPEAAVGFGNLVPAAAAVWVAYLFAWRLTSHIRHSVLAALALAFGSLLWPYSKFGFNAPLATLTLLGATYHLWIGTRTEYDRSLLWSGLHSGSCSADATRDDTSGRALLLVADPRITKRPPPPHPPCETFRCSRAYCVSLALLEVRVQRTSRHPLGSWGSYNLDGSEIRSTPVISRPAHISEAA